MEYWEFLIQKEGDRTWQPLASPVVALEEGRYRVVVRSSRTDTDVDIRIVHHSTDEDPPKRRFQKRSRRTNSEGLMVVIPFTDLKPGIWELHCRPDLFTDLMGDSWKHSVQLRVLSKAENAAFIAATQEREENLEIQPEKSEKSNPWASVFASKSRGSDAYPLLLTLDRETYMARQGQPLSLSGQVALTESAELFEDEAIAPPPVFEGELRICLRDPQTAQVLAERQHPLSEQAMPFSFSCDINIPPECKTRLILGEVTLYHAADTPDDAPLVLGTQSFTITADADELLSAVADNLSQTDLLELRPELSSASETLDLSLLDRAEAPKQIPFIRFQPSTGPSLPPRLYQPDPAKAASKPLELPTFGRPQPKAVANVEPSNADATADTGEDLPDPLQEIEEVLSLLADDRTSEVETEAPAHSPAETNVAPEEVTAAEPEPDEATATVEEKASEKTPAPVDQAFQALRMQDRFWSRLNAFATDEELSAWLKEAPIPEAAVLDSAPEKPLSGDRTPPDPAAMEFVVDDDPAELLQQNATSAANAYHLPEDEPIPTPELEVPKGELIAGQSIYIRVKLPESLPQLGVKLWIQDRQTRSLLEEPRWVVNFAPNGWDQLEAAAQVTIPFGCTEIRFEAIAIELQTQRQSHKVTLDRTVIPPDLPNVASNDVDFW